MYLAYELAPPMSTEEILELFGPEQNTQTTSEIAARLGTSKPAAWKRMAELHDRGLAVKHSATGLQSDAWSLSDEGRARVTSESVTEEA